MLLFLRGGLKKYIFNNTIIVLLIILDKEGQLNVQYILINYVNWDTCNLNINKYYIGEGVRLMLGRRMPQMEEFI